MYILRDLDDDGGALTTVTSANLEKLKLYGLKELEGAFDDGFYDAQTLEWKVLDGKFVLTYTVDEDGREFRMIIETADIHIT